MSAIAIIPARYDSSRFPGKILADDTGLPLIQHVFNRTSKASRVDRVIVATDDERIADAVRKFDGEVVMTKTDHPNGTSRIAEAVEHLSIDKNDLIVNVQGDEPEIEPSLIDLAVDCLENSPDCVVSTIASPFTDNENTQDPNIVKVVLDSCGRALYFTRSAIPYNRDGSDTALPLKHVGLYVYRCSFLEEYVSLAPTPLEQTEKLEQLRILEHGRHIAVSVVESHHHGIDTPEQYQAFVERYQAETVV